jgi:peptidoglycan-associated lipoprotein
MKYVSLLLAAIMVYAFFGCSPKVVETRPQVAPPPVQEPGIGADQADKRRGQGVTEEDLAKADRDRMGRLGQDEAQARERSALFKDIRFEYDSYSIKGDDLKRLKDMGAWLDRNKGSRLSVEGHCDERGTQEYNLMLGQKRAEVVKDYLVKLGVGENRIKTISYGKEQPLDTGHTEEAHAANRRVHFNIEKG